MEIELPKFIHSSYNYIFFFLLPLQAKHLNIFRHPNALNVIEVQGKRVQKCKNNHENFS